MSNRDFSEIVRIGDHRSCGDWGMDLTENASAEISNYINTLRNWRGKVVSTIRELIREAGPELIEEWKWRTRVSSYRGNVIAAAAFKDHVKVNFIKGASIHDSRGLFNSGLFVLRLYA